MAGKQLIYVSQKQLIHEIISMCLYKKRSISTFLKKYNINATYCKFI